MKKIFQAIVRKLHWVIAIPAILIALNFFIPDSIFVLISEARLYPTLHKGTSVETIKKRLDIQGVTYEEGKFNRCKYEYKKYNEYKQKGGTQACENIRIFYFRIPILLRFPNGAIIYAVFLDDKKNVEFHTTRVISGFL